MINDGQFPFDHVFQVIDGRAMVGAHGPREMPVWGRRLQQDVADGPGAEVRVSGAITALLAYLQAIQVPAPAPADEERE